jgi:hypothetical protein
VTDTLDTGDPGTLRWAISQANLAPGPHRITFAIPGPGVKTIHLVSNPPGITQATAIDGRTQPGYNPLNGPLVQIDGSVSSSGFNLFPGSAHSSMMGLTLNRFQNGAVYFYADACSLSACFVGVSADGLHSVPNGSSVNVRANQVLIGGHFSGARNILSDDTAVQLLGPANQDTVAGNYIGTDLTGLHGIAGHVGVTAYNETGLVIGGPGPADGNVICARATVGIFVNQDMDPPTGLGLQIQRNFIGTDASGVHAIANGDGIGLQSVSNGLIGGPGKGNVISGNSGYGIVINLGGFNEIYGNKIGVTADGAQALGNALGGILLGSSYNQIGSHSDDGTGNLIGGSSSADGISDYPGYRGNMIQGNAIGTSFNGAEDLGNAYGIVLESDSVTVGGPGPTANVVAHNSSGGITVAGAQVTIRGNSIFQSGSGLGIDLVGPKALQNFPEITKFGIAGDQVALQGDVTGLPLSNCIMDFYSNTECNGQGYGEGKSWLGSTTIAIDGTGAGLFSVLFPLTSVVGYTFTATATDSTGQTSEFSQCVSVDEPTAVPHEKVAYALGFANPSPARDRTDLPFALERSSHVTLRAFDVSGRRAATLFEGNLPAGRHDMPWKTSSVPAGIYFCRLDAAAIDGSGVHFQASRSVVVVR